MIGTKKNETTTSTSKYDVKVTKAHYIAQESNNEVISFDITVNGISIYGMIYRAGISKKSKEYEMISFPARKGTDGKYYNHCWFPIGPELMESLKNQIGGIINGKN